MTTTLADPDGVTTVTRPDGTVVTAELGPDPRFGMEAPLMQRMTITSPAGRRTTIARTRSVDLLTPGSPLALRTMTDTVTVNGRTQTTVYDAATRRFTDTSPTGRTLLTDVDGQGRPLRTAVGALTPVTYTYNARGQLTQSAQGPNRSQTFAYDNRRRVSGITDSLNRETTFTYDTANRPDKQTAPDGRVVDYDYDANGNLTRLTPAGKPAHAFEFSNRNVLERYLPPLVDDAVAPWTYTVDFDDLVTRIDRPGGVVVTYAYDEASRLERINQPRGATIFTYTPTTGRLASATAPGDEKIEYAYDGALVTQTKVSGSVAGTITTNYNDDFRITSETVAGTPAVTYAYDDDGALARAGATTLTRRPADGLLSGLSAGVSETAITHTTLGEPSSLDGLARRGDRLRGDLHARRHRPGRDEGRDARRRPRPRGATRTTAPTTWAS